MKDVKGYVVLYPRHTEYVRKLYPRHTKYVRGYIFFDRPSIYLLVCLSVNLTSKFCVKPLLIAHISVTTYQILFIFGP